MPSSMEQDTQHPPDHAAETTVSWDELPTELLRQLMRLLCPPQLLHLR